MSNRVKFKICGYEFAIQSDDSEEYIRMVGEKVGSHISKLSSQSSSISTTMAALFTAMEFCDEAIKSAQTADNLREQLKKYLDEAAAARSEVGELRRREQNLQRQLDELRLRLSKYEKNAAR